MATENAVMAAVLTPGETVIGNAACEPHVQDLCRFLVSLGARDRGHRLERPAHPRRRVAARRRVADRARTTSRSRASSASPRSPGRRDDRGRRAEGSGVDHPRVRAARRSRRGRRDSIRVPPGQELVIRERPRRPDPEDRGRPVARVPGRPDVDRRRRRDAGAGHGPDLREDVREPPVLRRQARRDGRADHPLRPAPRRRHRPRRSCTASAWRARTSAPAWRC